MGEREKFVLRELDEAGKEGAVYSLSQSKGKTRISVAEPPASQHVSLTRMLRNLFLPAGYPNSVSKDYLRYQILNALQAFCSSLAGLLASRAVLEGHGVGNAEASATDALLLTILQDIFGRLVTIASGYYLGTCLYPEAKTYRLLADIFNDMALVTDSLSPLLTTVAIDIIRITQFPFVTFQLASRQSPLRGIALCFSGICRALCGVVAGGSKAALTLHFAQPDNGAGAGDVGDISAKDGSKETVLALFGMLCGSALMPYVTGTQTTYALLAILVIAHILLNYLAVRGVVLRSLNRQRAGLLWVWYRKHPSEPLLTPSQLAAQERIFARPSSLYHTASASPLKDAGTCYIGSTLSSILPTTTAPKALWPQASSSLQPARWAVQAEPDWFISLIDRFSDEKFVVWFSRWASTVPVLHIILREGHTVEDHLKAWTLATELASRCNEGTVPFRDRTLDDLEGVSREARETIQALLPEFMSKLSRSQWDLTAAAGGFVTGLTTTLHVDQGEDRKSK